MKIKTLLTAAMVAAGLLGTLRVVRVEYIQDWLTQPVDADGLQRLG